MMFSLYILQTSIEKVKILTFAEIFNFTAVGHPNRQNHAYNLIHVFPLDAADIACGRLNGIRENYK